MAITGNSSTEKTVREKTLYTGLADCKVLAINPTLKELNDLEIGLQQEPQYIGDDGRVRLDFWVETQNEEAIKTKLSLWIEPEHKVSQTGKPQWINKYGKTAWANTIEETNDYFLRDGVRHAFTGEEDLHKFLQAFLNVVYDTKNKKYDDCQIDNMDKLFRGDFSELKNILTIFGDNTIRLLFGVKTTDSGTYQNVYNKFFEKTCVKANYTNWQKNAVDADYGAFKADFQGDWTFKPYTGSTTAFVPTADAEVTTSMDDDEF